MGMEPGPPKPEAWPLAVVAASAALGLALMVDQAGRSSATYDEVTYLRVAARWWRTGDQDAITRMGSPLTFWKLQQAPTLWYLDRTGRRSWVDDPVAHQAEMLPTIRVGGLWIWLVALLTTAEWARRLHGPRGMAMASATFALGPNLLAHGPLATMELPVVAACSGVFLGFWEFLRSGSLRAFRLSAALAGVAMSCKFTAVLIPPILGLAWAVDLAGGRRDGGAGRAREALGIGRVVGWGMARFVLMMVAANLVITGFATMPLSANGGEHPLLEGRFTPGFRAWAGRVFESSFPRDWVGFATQVVHQRNGGPSYLLGERRMSGWMLYYPIALAVKVPLAFWFLVAARVISGRRADAAGARWWFPPTVALAFVLAAILGSKRNYGVRYLLPVASPAIVWVSGLAEGSRCSRRAAGLGLAGMAASIALIHPHELTYFNLAAGGAIGGRRVLSDSNLDWGQGARALARLQRDRPELRDLTLFYFGDTDPGYYGVVGLRTLFDANRVPSGLPRELGVSTNYLAVSASLQWGPWGPPGYFRELNRLTPACFTDDGTIAIYRTADLMAARGVAPR